MASLSLVFDVPPSCIEEYAAEAYSELIDSQFSEDAIAISGLCQEEFVGALAEDRRFHDYLKYAAQLMGSSYFFEKVHTTLGETIYEYDLTEKIPEIGRLMNWLTEIEDIIEEDEDVVVHTRSGLRADENGIAAATDFLESLGYKVSKPKRT